MDNFEREVIEEMLDGVQYSSRIDIECFVTGFNGEYIDDGHTLRITNEDTIRKIAKLINVDTIDEIEIKPF